MKGGVVGLALLSLVMATAVGLLSMRSERRDPSKIRIGVPDGSGGLIIHRLMHGGDLARGEVVSDLDAYTMRDCCAGTSEWALGAEMLDVVLMCPDAARRLAEKDTRFEIVGPAVLNSDVLVIRPGAGPGRIGIAHKRRYQERLVKERFPGGCATVPMLPSSLPYAYERGIVDGVVVDVLRAFAISGERIPLSANGADLVTLVLVASKDFMASSRYRQFMELYERAVAELGDTGTLVRALEGYREIRWTDREVKEWRALRVRFVFPPDTGT